MPCVDGLVAYSDASHTPGSSRAAVAALMHGPGGLQARAQIPIRAAGSAEAERAAFLLAGGGPRCGACGRARG